MLRIMCVLVLAMPFLAGCSGGTATTREGHPGAISALPADTVDPRALKHFVDGSTYELESDFAKAILEFQDALRYSRDPAIYFALSRNYSFLGKQSLAIDAGREAVRLSPRALDYRRNLADIYYTAFQLDSAAHQYEQIVQIDSTDASAWFALGRIYETRKPLRALEIYEQILTRFGPDWNVLLQVAELYNKQGQYAKAAATLLTMKHLDPANQPLQRSLAQTYVKAGNYDEALKVYTELLALDPGNLDYTADMGGVYLLKQQYTEASKYFEPILSQDSVAIEVKLRIGQVYYDQMQRDSTLTPLAHSIFEGIRSEHPEDWRPYWFLGAMASLAREDSGAVANFRRMTELASWNPDGWVGLGLAYLGKNEFGEAARVLETGQRQIPNDFRLNYFLGVAYSRLSQQGDAARALERALQINAEDFEATAELAMVYDALKRHGESDSLYERALRMTHPSRDLALNNYAYALAERGTQLERAKEMSEEALKAQPDNDSYLDTRGWIAFKLGDYAEAERYIARALEKGKEKGEPSATLYDHMGDIYFMLGEKGKALEYWKAALKSDPENAGLKEKVSRGSL